MKGTERNSNDRAGIVFLFVLIGTVFLIDFYIEVSKISKVDQAVNISLVETGYFNPEIRTDPLSDQTSSENNNINSEQAGRSDGHVSRTMLQLGFILFMAAAFSYFPTCSFRLRNKIIKVFSNYISYIDNIFQNTALPRPPPQL